MDEIEQTEAALRELREREEELRRAHEGVERERVRASLEARKNERMLERFRELEIGGRRRGRSWTRIRFARSLKRLGTGARSWWTPSGTYARTRPT